MRTDSGQAAVESAITMPLTIFMALGTMQLFMMLQGRLMAEHAAFKAARAGSVNHASCDVMKEAAIMAVLPSFSSFLGTATPGATPAAKLGQAFRLRSNNKYDPAFDSGHSRDIIWIYRNRPLQADVTALSEEDFDDPDPQVRASGAAVGYRLEIRLVYWFPMRIPFANWVMSNAFRAFFGLGDYTGYMDPLAPVSKTKWQQMNSAALPADLTAEFLTRFNARQYSFPIQTTYAMRMLTPPRPAQFVRQDCQ
jgi:hypothetical protein